MHYTGDKLKVFKKTQFILDTCKILDVELKCEFIEEPVFHAILTNDRGDMASISLEHNLFEASKYAPEWSDSMTKWAEAEGFSESQIKTQNLMHTATLTQICKFFL
jgi:hypothetical protein